MESALLRSGLAELGNVSYQKGAWLDSRGSTTSTVKQRSSLEEAKCRAFLDSGFNLALKSGSETFSKTIDAKLVLLWKACDELEGCVNTVFDVESEHMKLVRTLAMELLSEIGNGAELG